MKLEIILVLVLVTTVCSARTLRKRSTDTDVETDVDVNTDVNDDVSDDVTEEETAVEAEKVNTTISEGQGQSEGQQQGQEQDQQAVDDVDSVDVSMATAKQTLQKDDKRTPGGGGGMGPGPGGSLDVPFQMPEVCTAWINDFFTQYLTLNEEREAVYSDLERFFIFMDEDGDEKISEDEFKSKWMLSAGFGELDTLGLFYMFFARVGNPADESHIVPDNVEAIWEDIFMTDKDGGYLSKEYFSDTWTNILLPALPQHGCSGLNSDLEEVSVVLAETSQIRPDVYSYYKRKRK